MSDSYKDEDFQLSAEEFDEMMKRAQDEARAQSNVDLKGFDNLLLRLSAQAHQNAWNDQFEFDRWVQSINVYGQHGNYGTLTNVTPNMKEWVENDPNDEEN